MTRELSAIIKDYVETKKSLDYYININSSDDLDVRLKESYRMLKDSYEKELEHKVLAIYNGTC
jgi:hypothetical protein